MCPVLTYSLIFRPRFAWDPKRLPWTDGKWNQGRFRTAVYDWKEYHAFLQDTTSNKIAPKIQAIILNSQLNGQAADVIADLTNEDLKNENGVKLIVHALYQRYFLSFISEAYEGLNTLLNTRRSQSKSLKNFETRFSAAFTKLNSFSNTTRLPQGITALMLLSNASIEHSRRTSALAAAAPNGTVFSDQSSNDDFLDAVTYKQLSSVVNQCEMATTTTSSMSLSSSSAGTLRSPRRGRGNGFRRPLNAALKRHPCHTCDKYGHGKDTHNKEGSLQSGVMIYNTAAEFIASIGSGAGPSISGNNSANGKRKSVSFNMAVLSGNKCSLNDIIDGSCNLCVTEAMGPLVNDGAPYSAIGNVRLRLVENHIGNDAGLEIEPIRLSLTGHTHWQYGKGDRNNFV